MIAHPRGWRHVVTIWMYLHHLPAGLGRPVFTSQRVFHLKHFTKEKIKDTFFFGGKNKAKTIPVCGISDEMANPG